MSTRAEKPYLLAVSNSNGFVVPGFIHWSRENCQALAGRWSLFFTQLSQRFITDVSALVCEIMTRQVIEALQQQVKTETDIANKQYYKRQSQAIHQWYNAWLQQKEE